MSPMTLLPNETTHPSYSWRPGNLLSYGLPFEVLAAAHISRLGKNRILLLASASLAKNTSEVEKLEAALSGKIVAKRIGMTPHSYWTEILEVTEQARQSKADLILVLGGGSLIDAAKLASLVVDNANVDTKNPDSLKPYVTGGAKGLADSPSVQPATVPIICVPTTLSGGEYSPFAGCTDPRDETKYTFIHPSICPAVLILDGELCKTVPIDIWLTTGVRSIDHCVEMLCRLTNPDASIDGRAKEGLVLLASSMIKLRKNPNDAEERLKTLIGARLAMEGVCKRILFGGSHAIGHALGSLGIPHGVTSCVMLPATMKYNKRINATQQEACKQVLFSDPVVAKALEDRACFAEFSDLGDALDTLLRAFGVPQSLKEINFASEADLDRTADRTLIDVFCSGNPIPLDKAEVLKILNKVL